MATVGDILAGKGTCLISIGPDATVLDAAQLMNQHHIGCVVVMSGQGPVGVFTERDIMQRVVASARIPVRPWSARS